MKLWRENKLDQEWEATIEQIADWYMESEWPGVAMLVERKLRIFMTHEGPVNSVWEQNDPEFDRLLDLVIEREHQRDSASASGDGG